MRKWIALFLTAAALVALVGCGQKPAAQEPPAQASPSGPVDGGTLYLSMYSAPKGVFNPVLYEDQYDANIIGLVYQGLLKLNESLEYVPELAERFEISADNRTVTFHLRKDVKWHDGEPFTARDVAFTFRTILHPNYPGVRAGDFMVLAGAEAFKAGQSQDLPGVQVVDDHTIRFTTVEPTAPILERLAFPIIPEHIFGDVDPAKLSEHANTRNPIGTGPFKFVQYKADQYVELVRNDQFADGRPHVERVIYRIVNQEVALGQMQSGELDYIPAKPGDVPVLERMAGVEVHPQPSFSYQYLGLNHRNPFLADQRVRKAIAHAINRKGIVDKLLDGQGVVLNSHMPPVSWAYDPNALDPYPFDPAQAETYLREAGFTEKDAQGYYVKDGKRLSFTLLYPSGNKVREQSAPLIQDNLRQVGIEVKLEMLEFATLATRVFDERNMDMWLMGWSLTTDPDPAGIFLPTSDNKWAQVTGWDTPENRDLIERGLRVLSVEERKPIYVEWAKLVNDQLPYVFLYSPNDIHAVSTRIQGVAPDMRGAFWNIHEIWIPTASQQAS